MLALFVGVDSGDGTGGNISLGGGRRGANLIQIDGAGSTGTFFGGEARGSDRIPFAFSIESVEEFQVVSNGFDVEFGFFSGGVINAVRRIDKPLSFFTTGQEVPDRIEVGRAERLARLALGEVVRP